MKSICFLKKTFVSVFFLVLLTNCSKVIIKDLNNIRIFYKYGNERFDLTDSTKIPLLEKYNGIRSYIPIVIDLADAETLKFIKNIKNEKIDGYIVIKNLKGQEISRHKIIPYEEYLIKKTETHILRHTNERVLYKEYEENAKIEFPDTTSYLPQYVFINDDSVFQKENCVLYFQADIWKEKKTLFKNLCSTPKFISIESNNILVELGEDTTFHFFVEAYYRPTTRENLADLVMKIQNEEVDLPITIITQNDSLYAIQIENALEKFYIDAQRVFENYIQHTEHLLLQFTGYTDPRDISIKYLEETIIFENKDPEFPDINIEQGSEMNNMILSQLRAYFTMQYVDALFSKSPQYQQLKKQERIHFRVIGKGPDESQEELEKARKVDISIIRIPPPEVKSQ